MASKSGASHSTHRTTLTEGTLRSQGSQNHPLSLFRSTIDAANLLRRSALLVGLTQQTSGAQTQAMLEAKRSDSGTHLVRHVHQLEIGLLIAADLGALYQHAEQREIDSLPRLAIHHELSAPTRQRRDNLRSQPPSVLTIEFPAEPNPICRALVASSCPKHGEPPRCGLARRHRIATPSRNAVPMPGSNAPHSPRITLPRAQLGSFAA
jgi:hypothetical protein